MYKHHEESIEVMKGYFCKMEGVIALVLGGSVAKGNERPDSDLDAMVILTDAAYEKRKAEGKTAECIYDLCTYEGGYFDVKYMNKAYIAAAADKGSEPTRNSFTGSRVLFTSDSEIPGIVARIPVFQEGEKADKLLSFTANLNLNYHYFWCSCHPEGYMRVRVAGEIVYSVYRIFLQENGKLFQCHRRLEEDVERLGGAYAEAAALGKKLCESLTDENCNAFVDKFRKLSGFEAPPHDIVLSRYLDDFEQWWLNPRPLVAEW